MKKLREIAETFTGHTLRAKVENDPAGQCAIIQLKDLNSADYTRFQHTPYRISMDDIPPYQALRKGDLLFLSKGTNNKALLYEGQFGTAAAASMFIVIRTRADFINPDFLAWYINSSAAQEYFKANRAGTTTLNLSKKAIEELDIPVPSLAKQALMMKLVKKHEHFKSLTAEYEYNTKLLVENILNNHLNGKIA